MTYVQTLAFSLLVLVMSCGISVSAQPTFVQFIVLDLENENQCRIIEDSVRAHAGFQSVRTESYYGNFYAVFQEGTSYTKDDFRSWLIPLGFDLYCFRTGVLGVDPTTRLKRKECELLELKQQE